MICCNSLELALSRLACARSRSVDTNTITAANRKQAMRKSEEVSDAGLASGERVTYCSASD